MVLASSKDFVLNEVTTHHDQYHQNSGGLADDVLELAVLNKCLEALRSRRWLETPTMNGVSEAWRQLLTSAQQKGYEAWLEMNMDTLNRLDLRWESNNSRSVVDCGDGHQSTPPVWKLSAPLHEVAPSAGDTGVSSWSSPVVALAEPLVARSAPRYWRLQRAILEGAV